MKMSFKCPYCDFSALSKKVLEQHISEVHKEELEKKKEEKKKPKGKTKGDFVAKISNNYDWVKVVCFDNEVFEGRITQYSLYQIELKTKNGHVWIYKHAIKYILPIKGKKT